APRRHRRSPRHDSSRARAGGADAMKIQVASTPPPEVEADALVIGLPAESKSLPSRLAALDQRAEGPPQSVLAAQKLRARPAAITHVHTAGRWPTARVVIGGLGNPKELAPETIRRGAAAGLRRARDLGARRVAIDVLGDRLPERQRAHATVEGAILGTYTFDRYKNDHTHNALTPLIS